MKSKEKINDIWKSAQPEKIFAEEYQPQVTLAKNCKNRNKAKLNLNSCG